MGKSMMFRSTGSYEPDHNKGVFVLLITRFDPQALTSLTLILPLSFL